MPHFDARWQRPETLQAIFNQISDAIFFYDKNLHVIRVNNSAEQLFGLSAEQMVGKGCWELFGELVSESGQGGNGQGWRLPSGTVRVRVKGGRERRLIIRNIELVDQAGELEGVVATATDITNGRHDAATIEIDETPYTGPSAHDKHRRLVYRNRIVATVATFFLLVLVVFGVSKLLGPDSKQLTGEEKQRKEKREAAARFNAMTPAQHIERAKSALKTGATLTAIEEGLRHLEAIPASAREASRAKLLQIDLTRAENLANAQSLIDASSNADLRAGMEKLQHATVIIDGVSQQHPDNTETAQLSSAVQRATEQLAMRFPQEFAAAETKLVNFSWEKGGFGTVMIANFTVRNESSIDLADLKFRCEHYSADGIVVDQNAATSYVTVKAHSTTRIPNVNMGFLNSQTGNVRTTKTDCEIVSLRLASESHSLGTTR